MVNGISGSNSYMSYLQTQMPRSRPDPAEMFKKIDADGSGGISALELEAMAQNMSTGTGQSIDTGNAISTYDSDENGELSSEEMQAFMESTMQQGLGMIRMHGGPGKGGGSEDLFKALDADSSDGISQSELDTWAQNMSEETLSPIDTSSAISTYDTDGSGELSSTEFKNFLDATGIKPPPPPETSENTESISKADSVMSKYDTDGDGVLSSTELQAYLNDNDSLSSMSLTSALSIIEQALNAYLMNMGKSTNSADSYLNSTLYGSSYTSVDYMA